MSFWAAVIEGRISANVDFMVQLGARGSLWIVPRLFPRVLILHPTPLKPNGAIPCPQHWRLCSFALEGDSCGGHGRHNLEPRAEKSLNKEVY